MDHFKVRSRRCTNDIEVDSFDLLGKRVLVTPLTKQEASELATMIAKALDDLNKNPADVKLYQG